MTKITTHLEVKSTRRCCIVDVLAATNFEQRIQLEQLVVGWLGYQLLGLRLGDLEWGRHDRFEVRSWNDLSIVSRS